MIGQARRKGMHFATALAKKFAGDERGSMAIELVLVVPILTWVLLSTFVYFDAFRTEANAKRAAITVTDMFSREETEIDENYLDGALKLLKTLTYADSDPDLRVTVYTFSSSADAFQVVWSRNVGMTPNLTDANLAAFRTKGRLPVMADGDQSILVETRTEYSAPFTIGIGPFTGGTDLDDVTFETFTFVRPRFTDKLCWVGGDLGDAC